MGDNKFGKRCHSLEHGERFTRPEVAFDDPLGDQGPGQVECTDTDVIDGDVDTDPDERSGRGQQRDTRAPSPIDALGCRFDHQSRSDQSVDQIGHRRTGEVDRLRQPGACHRRPRVDDVAQDERKVVFTK